MSNPYAFLDIPQDVESTWQVISKSELSAAKKLEIVTALFTKHVAQLKLEDRPAALMYVACRELMDLKTFAGVNSKIDNAANQEFDAEVLKLLTQLEQEVVYCDKNIKFTASKVELSLANQTNRTRLSRVQLMAVKVFDYAEQWSTGGKEVHKRALALLQVISACSSRFETAQDSFIKSLSSKSTTKAKSFRNKTKTTKR